MDTPLPPVSRYLRALPVVAVLWAGYAAAGHPLRPPVSPLVSPVDQLVPFVPATAWVYVPGYAAALCLAGWTIDTQRKLRAATLAFSTALLGAVPFFVLWPIRCQRPEAPPAGSGGTAAILRFVAWIDTPYNTFPSLHIAMVTLAAWVASQSHPRLGRACWALAAGVWFSVLTLKQHYFVDLVGGWALAGMGAAVWKRAIAESSLNFRSR